MHAASWRLAFVAGMLLAVVPRTGSAQDAESPRLMTPLGEYILLGGGVTEFTDDAVKDAFDTGGTWDVRLGVGSRYYLGGEIAYVGSIRSGVGLVPDLMTNGAEGILRLQYPYATGNMLVEPFAFGGIGWSRVSFEDPIAPGLDDSDDIGVVPFGGGVTLGFGRFLVDARFTYRTSFSEDLGVSATGSAATFDQWAVNGAIGYEF
jgi:hypothetical protein